MLATGKFLSPTPATSVIEVRSLPHEVGHEDHLYVYVEISGCLGPGMGATGTFSSAASAMSVVEVRDLHP